jgi:glycosyltransferase involved in cell wall biosynthesis
MPRVSVLVAVFNGAKTLQRCIDSVAGQTYPDRELIVIDGGSRDGTREILERNTSKIAYWVSEPDHGVSHAWNKGLERARGDWICFLGADDYLWAPDVLERLAPALKRAYPPTRVVYGRVAIVNERGGEIIRAGEDWRTAGARLTDIMSLAHPGLMHHRSLFDAHGRFDESFRIAGDYELLLRELPRGGALFAPDIVVAGMQQGGISTAPSGSLAMMREMRRAQVVRGYAKPSKRWIAAYVKSWLRVWMWRVLGGRIAPYVFDLLRLLNGKPRYWTRQ